MKNYEQLLAEAVRIEYNENTGELFLVFKVVDEKFKQLVKQDWAKDIELKLINKGLFEND
jgi:hypothetical protein